MAILRGFPPSNEINTGGGTLEKEMKVSVKVTMPDQKLKEFGLSHDPDVGWFYIGKDDKLYLMQED